MLDLLMQLTHSPQFEGTRAHSLLVFLGDALEGAPSDARKAAIEHPGFDIAFNSWLIFDAPIAEDGSRLLDAALPSMQKRLTSGQLRYLEIMRESTLRLYEVRELRRDEGLLLRDLWSMEEVWVNERALTQNAAVHHIFGTRVVDAPRDGKVLDGAVVDFPPMQGNELVAELRREYKKYQRNRSGATEWEFFKERGGLVIQQAWLRRFDVLAPRMQTTEGDPFEPQALLFDILDRAALIEALDARSDFDRFDEQSELLFGWLDMPGSAHALGAPPEGRRSLGTLRLQGERLRCEVLSASRAVRLRKLLDECAPTAVRYRIGEILSPSAAGERGAARSPISPEEETRVLGEILERYYRNWLDEPIPALGNRTPRHAALLKTIRPRLIALVKELELGAKGSEQPALAGVDFSQIRAELGIGRDE